MFLFLDVLYSKALCLTECIPQKAFPDVPDAPCPVTRSAKQGDYQFNGAMALAGILKVS